MQMKIAETICIETRLKLTFRIPTYIDVGLLFEAASQRADGTFTADVNGFTMRFEWIIPRPLNAFAFFFPFHASSDLLRTHFIFELRKPFNSAPRKRELIRANEVSTITDSHQKRWKVSNKRAWNKRTRVYDFNSRSPLYRVAQLSLWETENSCIYFIFILMSMGGWIWAILRWLRPIFLRLTIVSYNVERFLQRNVEF